jgi:hypothetical protein
VRGSGASTGCTTTATGSGRTGGNSTASRTDNGTVNPVQQLLPPHALSGRITGSLLCRLQQACALPFRRQHSMPRQLGPDHIATSGIACISRNSTRTTLPRQRRPATRIKAPNVTASRVS